MSRSPRSLLLLSAALFTTLSLAACAFGSEVSQYPDTRFVAPLPGSLFGVTPDGKAGFDGAMNITVPTAYTPGAGNIVIGANAGSNREHSLPDRLDGGPVNGSFLPGIGFTVCGHNLYGCDMATSKKIETLIGTQLELCPQTSSRPSIAIGVSDLLDARGPHADPHSARSAYIVATKEFTNTRMPMFLTLGYGSRRYNDRPIGALSIQPWDRWRVIGEYDGFGTNLATAFRVWRTDHDGWNLMAYGQYQNMAFPGVGFTITRSR